MNKKKLIKKRLKALENASTVLDWTLAVRMAKWGQLNHPEESSAAELAMGAAT